MPENNHNLTGSVAYIALLPNLENPGVWQVKRVGKKHFAGEILYEAVLEGGGCEIVDGDDNLLGFVIPAGLKNTDVLGLLEATYEAESGTINFV